MVWKGKYVLHPLTVMARHCLYPEFMHALTMRGARFSRVEVLAISTAGKATTPRLRELRRMMVVRRDVGSCIFAFFCSLFWSRDVRMGEKERKVCLLIRFGSI